MTHNKCQVIGGLFRERDVLDKSLGGGGGGEKEKVRYSSRTDPETAREYRTALGETPIFKHARFGWGAKRRKKKRGGVYIEIHPTCSALEKRSIFANLDKVRQLNTGVSRVRVLS